MSVEISTDKKRIDLTFIHGYLTRSYWSKGISIDKVEKAINNSLCFSVYDDGKQVGFARVTTDYTLFAYIADLFIIEEYRGKGLSKKLMSEIVNHNELKNIRAWMLATRDAHGLYEKFGFKKIEEPEKYMVLKNPNFNKDHVEK